jgi:adenosylcobinamide amidohydrolase
MRALASTALGGGLGEREWVIDAQVEPDYDRTDPAEHLDELARRAGCTGAGVGFLTAARVDHWTAATAGDVAAYATVGLQHPEWAAADAVAAPSAVVHGGAAPGTINVVAFVPVPLSDAAMVNAVVTATEAKAQALIEHDVAGTGTASDAVCVLAPVGPDAEQFCGPRSAIGSELARAVRDAVAVGTHAWIQRHGGLP